MIFLMAYEIEGKKCDVISWIKSRREEAFVSILPTFCAQFLKAKILTHLSYKYIKNFK